MMQLSGKFFALALPFALQTSSATDSYRAGRAAYDAGNYDLAVKSFERAIQIDDKTSDYHLWLARAIGTEAVGAGIFHQPGMARRAKSEFERALQLNPKNISARDGLLQFYLRAPGLIGGSMTKAREQADAIARANPLRGHLARAAIAAHAKDQVTVEREHHAAVLEYPDSSVAVFTYANWLATNARADEALLHLEHFLTRHPGEPSALVWLGRIATTSGKQLNRGEQALRQAMTAPSVGVDPNAPAPAMIHFRLGELLTRKGDKGQARKEFEAAVRLNPNLDAAKKAMKSL